MLQFDANAHADANVDFRMNGPLAILNGSHYQKLKATYLKILGNKPMVSTDLNL